ncbi:MAG: hypothetical protein A2087_02845 [Spirochaetes bacterium GWD1_61_31]|nr:MAG: hypothetical protein A2Y37_03740 [Spirochaetes bacterium GWB1_60_80]OHD28601.1 MAG: hypothetical protein A2004_06005 [Spirochaetes bacterium GWC1_61_12]OHD37612.1 MAG: hypothetical protein A2087_02845 [Spirochaetes bacterium GWD1_61_31]OHD44344.1 MAG: hypothetical protein A2Y35_09480 [Spirochaetes bacterium GWE1_60_18]OHD61040.1 MAG: hypothetical protein A2Y32_05005 [Spirochaetes bacterium GWF1_60_12]HAP44758.1 hypothetical protein [Spirochaetaceae bacterium]
MTTFPDKAPNCLACRHFKVSWDAAFPRSCRQFGIKSRQLPSIEVFRATGQHCPVFERNPAYRET